MAHENGHIFHDNTQQKCTKSNKIVIVSLTKMFYVLLFLTNVYLSIYAINIVRLKE
jgi:hypothetical protein